MAMNNQFTPIEYLVIDHFCSLNELASLTSYTPQFRCLILHKGKSNDSNIMVLLSSITLANLKWIYLNLSQTTFNELEIFITKIFPNLKSLSIIKSEDITFLDAHRWEQLILNYFPQLEKFYLIYDDYVDNEQKYPIYTRRPNQLSSSFWIERQWLFEAEVRYTHIEYTIHPCSPVLIQAVNLLPDITTLKIHSLSTDETEELNVKRLLILCSMKETSKITKIYLEEIDNVQELDFLFTLCPDIVYFKVRYINTMDIQSFLCTIFKKINHNNNNHHLHSLCFHVLTADDQIVENIEEIIKCEKLFPHFTIKRILNTVYLQWK
ncbi:unnamed protein product [Rotaria sordida]|uniref:F-box domain-containing protein n=1 Tax=Rotaria sordida TaxID=392033 RepID=A0A815IVS7_9BILA|nr:unnamed protein product [Rotaria sordida]